MGPHSRKKWSNKHEVTVTRTGTLCASYGGEFTYRIYTHLMPDCLKHLIIDACQSVKAFIAYRDTPGGPIAYLNSLSSASNLIKDSFYGLQTLLGDFCLVRKFYCYYNLSLHYTWYHFADLPVLGRMATQYMDNNTTDLALDILC